MPLVTIAAVKAPSSNWPSMATLITPDREQMTPVSAPSMMGIELAKVPCSRFTTLTPVVSPASAQQNSETMNKNMTSAIATRRHHLLSGRKARSTATAIDTAPHT